jgi:hypothetical protein
MKQKKYSDIYIGFNSAIYGTRIVERRENIAQIPKDVETIRVGNNF